jgi:hypothetical protein
MPFCRNPITFIALIIIGCCALSSCNFTPLNTQLTHTNGITIEARIHKARELNHGNIKSIFVYGQLDIKSQNRQLVKGDISCIRAIVDSHKSDAIYIDSVASTFNQIEAKNGGISVDVYWVFNEIEASVSKKPETFRLEVDDKNEKSCFWWAD